jgi:acetyltransferase-like isoleucine patch superfamily enzyme
VNAPLYGLFGAGGAARAILPMMRHGSVLGDGSPNGSEPKALREVCLIETNPRSPEVAGFAVYHEASFFRPSSRRHFCCIAIGNSVDRKQVADRVGFADIPNFSVISRNSIIETSLPIGKGAIVCANTYISVNVQIGVSFFMNIGSILEHDCAVGDFVTFSPGVVCAGNVKIEDQVPIGAGAVVLNSIGSGQTVVGNPARPV